MHQGRSRTQRRTHRVSAPEWEAFHAQLLDPTQIAYEEIRPVVVLGQAIKDRAAEVGVTPKTLSKRVEQFIQHGIPGLIADSTHSPQDKRLLPQPVRERILQLKVEYPPFSSREIAAIIEVQLDRRMDHRSIERVLAQGPLPKIVGRRYPRYAAMHGTIERRAAMVRLHVEGWSERAIAGYLGAPQRTVYRFLRRWASDAVVKRLGDHPRGRRPGGRKVTLPVVATVKTLQETTDIGEFRMAAALKQQYGIDLSPRTCGRIMAKNRDLYGIGKSPPAPEKPKQPMPFATQIPHRWWSVDLCYIEHHHVPGIKGPLYVWTILDNYSRHIVASAPSKTQTLWDFLLVLFTAIYVHGAPIGLVSDSGSVFTANVSKELYTRLGIEKVQIDRGQPWQNYCESNFLIMKHLEAYRLEEATSWEEFCAVHARYVGDFNHQDHFAHQQRADGLRTPAEVLGGVKGRRVAVPTLQDVFELLLAQRRVDPHGYIRFDGWRVYGEEGLSGQQTGVWLAKESHTLTLAYGMSGAMQPVAQYAVTFAPEAALGATDERTVQPKPHKKSKHGRTRKAKQEITALQELYTFPSPLPSRQPHLWEAALLQDIEWRKVYRLPPRVATNRQVRHPDLIQLSLFA